MVNIPTVRLNDGYEMPVFGLGTYNAEGDEMVRLVCDAIDLGYRHIDGAMMYGNEVDVGRGIQKKIAEKVVERKDLFIVSKLWATFMRADLVETSLRKTLKDLQLDYLDLYLIHWPFSFKEGTGSLEPKDENGLALCSTAHYLDTWKSMEACVEKGLVRSIGVSNFNSEQMTRLINNCAIKPVTNQVEIHAYFGQKQLIKHCSQWGVILTAYAPLGRPGYPKDVTEPVLLNDPVIQEIAAKYSATPAQVALSYLTTQKLPVIPKTASKSRLQENLNSLNLKLTAREDMTALDALNSVNYRMSTNFLNYARNHPEYPFHIPY